MTQPFPDLVAALLTELEPFGETFEETNEGLQAVLEAGENVVRVVRAGGNSDRFTDYPRVIISVFAKTRPDARNASVAIEAYLQDAVTKRNGRVGDIFVDSVRTDTGPETLPNTEDDARQWTSIYKFSVRRQ